MIPQKLLPLAGLAAVVSAAVQGQNLTVAMVRAPPPQWPLPIYSWDWVNIQPNLTSSIDKGIEYIEEAKDNGANWIVFPELWFPGFPKGALYNNWTNTHLPTYLANSMVVGGHEWNRLVSAIKNAELYASINFAQKDGGYLYMAQALISPTGKELILRHKLRPSGDERYIFSDGTINEFKVVNTTYGRVGMLECGEHVYPSMTFPMQAQVENFHLGPFPYLGDPKDERYLWWEGAESNIAAGSHYAVLSGAYSFFPAVGFAFVSSPFGQVVNSISANVSFEEHPILYHSLDTAGFDTTRAYDSDGQVSWAVLRQMVSSFPGYIPEEEGDLVPRRNATIKFLLSGALNSSEVNYNN
ncbi:aliphatic nitrilase [Aspergillus steynii IBT 23096]|uniref:Aliphatic nitrilase n=1 Tax=Aspergillus steynii IBT 23096 TaxID=1392250 RepID=A0A2I2GI08_9EURO|nr:aliphatic nitrilase [Aspergillus steynii IBT 23096]PLB52510.1 aliphatic nitrilase [Aspergillus steynii IBT 23096]